MKRINYSTTDFTDRAMLPEPGDDLTAVWGRKVVRNVFSGWAITGTVFINEEETVRIPLGLNKRFGWPPAVYLIWKDVTSTDDATGWKTNSEGGQYKRDIMVALTADGVLMRNGLENLEKRTMVVYKIHGV